MSVVVFGKFVIVKHLIVMFLAELFPQNSNQNVLDTKVNKCLLKIFKEKNQNH